LVAASRTSPARADPSVAVATLPSARRALHHRRSPAKGDALAKSSKEPDWHHEQRAHFWSTRYPWDQKFETEKNTGVLLDRVAERSPLLVYEGTVQSVPLHYTVTLGYEAAEEKRNLYAFHVRFTAVRGYFSIEPRGTVEEATKEAKRIFAYWCGKLGAGDVVSVPAADARARERYEERVRQALEAEERAKHPVVDHEAIAQLQRDILGELRKGRSFRSSHHEGGTVIAWTGSHFVESTYGVEESVKRYESDEDFLKGIRAWFDWDSRKETYPHRPPELEVWQYIRGQLWP
jgi:hypothetical protein